MITSCATGPASFFTPARAISLFLHIGAFDAQFTSVPEHILLGTERETNKWNHQEKKKGRTKLEKTRIFKKCNLSENQNKK